MINFVAIDFETANKSPNSACSLAAVTVENGKIVKRGYSLIKPPFMNFDDECIAVHGIQPEEVLSKPTFDKLWPNIYENHLKGKLVIAHNAKFDIGVLRATLSHYDIKWPELNYACTVQIARKVWPNLFNHRLNTVGAYLGIQFEHHQALDDAQTCAKVALAAAHEMRAASLEDLLNKLSLPIEKFINEESVEQTSLF